MAVFGNHGNHGNQGNHGNHGNNAGGGASPALTYALAQTAEALMGYWDGTVPPRPHIAADPLTRLLRMQPDARMATLTQEAMSLYNVAPDGTGYALRAGGGAGDAIVHLTPPNAGKTAAQMADLRSAMDLRADRMTEIMVQQTDLLSFFGAQQGLTGNRKAATMLMLHTLMAGLIPQEMRIKHFCSTPRPVDLWPQIQPMIQTPGHSAYPSGHATEAFAFATLIAALRLAGSGIAAPDLIPALLAKLLPVMESASTMDPDVLLFRLAARIADNRTVAGVHYPMDSAHGGLFGFGTTLAFIGHCLGGGEGIAVPTWHADADDWRGDFTLRKWCAELGDAADRGWRGASVELPKAEDWHLLPLLWTAAVAEWGQVPVAPILT